MTEVLKHPSVIAPSTTSLRRRVACVMMLIVDVGLIAWGIGAAAFLDRLLGPGGRTILPAAFEGYSNGSWADLVETAPMAAAYMNVLYRTYGMYNVALGLTLTIIAATAFRRGDRWAWWALLSGNTIALVSAIAYDRIVKAIGPFELTEYLGLAMVWAACAITAPFFAARRVH
jgi:hypothetical protein